MRGQVIVPIRVTVTEASNVAPKLRLKMILTHIQHVYRVIIGFLSDDADN